MNELRAGVVGLGVMGWNHLRVLQTLPDVRVTGVADPDPGARARAADSFGAAVFSDLDGLLEAGVDVLVVAAPNAWHAPLGVRALQAGAHVLIEKPIAPTLADARALIEAARAAGRKLMVGHVERFNPAVRAAAAAAAGESIVSISITRVGPFPPRMSEVGVVIDLGVHDIDLVRMIAGADIVEAQAQIAPGEGGREDTALMQFRTANGVIAQVNANWVTPYKARSLHIATRSKFIRADLITREVVEFFEFRPDGSYGTRHLGVAMGEPLREELLAFMHAVRTDSQIPVSGEDAMRNLEIALQCLGASARGAGTSV